jgi:hypothetical protein
VLTVKDVANAFRNAKQEALRAGELSPRTWADYRAILDALVGGLGKHRAVTSLGPELRLAPGPGSITLPHPERGG